MRGVAGHLAQDGVSVVNPGLNKQVGRWMFLVLGPVREMAGRWQPKRWICGHCGHTGEAAARSTLKRIRLFSHWATPQVVQGLWRTRKGDQRSPVITTARKTEMASPDWFSSFSHSEWRIHHQTAGFCPRMRQRSGLGIWQWSTDTRPWSR